MIDRILKCTVTGHEYPSLGVLAPGALVLEILES